MSFERRVSGVERLWLVTGDIAPPFANQLVIEGTGVLNVEAWKVAVAEAAAVNPGSRLVLRGHLWWARWVDSGFPPPVVVVDGSSWDGQSEVGADFLTRPLPPETGPTCEILLVVGQKKSLPPRVIVRSHHAVMDGGGHLYFTNDIFRCLRGETPIGAASKTTDADVARMYNVSPPPVNQADISALPTGLGNSQGREASGLLWRRRFLPGRHSRLLPRVMVALAEAAREYAADDSSSSSSSSSSTKSRFTISVNLRRHLPPPTTTACDGRPETRSTANITGSIPIDVDKDATAETVQNEIKRQLESHRDVQSVKRVPLLHIFPRSFIRSEHDRQVEHAHSSSQWKGSGLISNLGNLDADDFRGGDFCGQRYFFVPPATEIFPFFLSMTGNPGGVELCVTQPRRLGDNGRLERCLDQLVAALTTTMTDHHS